MMYHWGYGLWWFGGGLLMILMLGGLAVLLVLLVRTADRGSHHPPRVSAVGNGAAANAEPKQPSAREILDVRYARGELTQDEYETMRRTLAG